MKSLSRSQLKNVNGGLAGGASCTAICGRGASVSCTGITCTAIDYKFAFCTLPDADAITVNCPEHGGSEA